MSWSLVAQAIADTTNAVSATGVDPTAHFNELGALGVSVGTIIAGQIVKPILNRKPKVKKWIGVGLPIVSAIVGTFVPGVGPVIGAIASVAGVGTFSAVKNARQSFNR